MSNLDNKSGFTIVELLISSAVFSFILVAVSVTVVEIGRLYYKGTVLSRTQDAARNVIDNISRPIQLEGSTVVEGGQLGDVKAYCIGATRYTVAFIEFKNHHQLLQMK
jgi:prepilin-type N-terminal cleavage/methylation domain-containing protein